MKKSVSHKGREQFLHTQEQFSVKEFVRSRPIHPTVNILGQKRSLWVNIFLNQFKDGEKSVLNAINSCQGLNSKELENLRELLPATFEMEAIKSQFNYLGTLGRDEYFFFKLSQIPHYELKIEAMLQREKYQFQINNISVTLDKILKSCHLLTDNTYLTYFLSVVFYVAQHIIPVCYNVKTGNYKLEDIPDLLDFKPDEPAIPTYFHAVVDVAELQDKHLLDFTKKAHRFEKLSRIPLESLEDKIRLLSVNVRDLTQQLVNGSTDLFLSFREFIEFALNNTFEIKEKFTTVKMASAAIAEKYSQPQEDFKLNECFRIFAIYFRKITRVCHENHQRRNRMEYEVNTAPPQEIIKPERKKKKVNALKEKRIHHTLKKSRQKTNKGRPFF